MPRRRDPLAVFALPVDRPWPGFLLVAVLALAAAVLLPRGRADFSLEELYPQDSPSARFAAEHRARFGTDDDVIFPAREGDPFDPRLAEVAEAIAGIEGIADVAYPAAFEAVLPDADGVIASRPLRPGDRHPIATGLLVAPDGSAGAVVARVDAAHNHHADRDRILHAIEAILAEDPPSGEGSWHLAGIPVIRTWFVRLMGQDMGWLVSLAFLVSTALFALSFRDARHTLLGMAGVALGAACAGGFYVLTGRPFNIFSPAFFAVIVVVGTSDIVHLVHRFHDDAARLDDPRAAARAAAREVGFACLLTSLTTAIGFFALTTTELPPIRTFGLATGVGVMLTYLVTFLLVPPLLARLPAPSGRAAARAAARSRRVEALGRAVLRHRRPVLVGAAAFAAVMGVLASRTRVEHKVLEEVRPHQRVAVDQRWVEEHLGAVLPLEVEVRFDGRDPRDPEALAAVDALAAWIRARPIAGQVVALGDLARLAWEALGGHGLPPTRAAVGQALLVLGMGSEDPVPAFLWEGRDAAGEPDVRTRIVARVDDAGYHPTVALVRGIEARAAELLGPLGGTATVTGVGWLSQQVISTLTRQLADSFGLALLLIGAVWLASTRSPRRTLVALAPSLLPLVALLGIMGLTGTTLKPATAMVFSVALGIAVDDAIHFLAVYERGRRRQLHPETAALNAYRTAGRSLVDTTVLLVAGFLVLGASAFTATSAFGLLTAWTLVVALGANVLVLGPLLVATDRAGAEPSGAPAQGQAE